MGELAIVAIGGNSLVKDRDHTSVEDQYNAICETAVSSDAYNINIEI